MPPSARSVKATPWLRSGPLGLASCSAIASSIHRSWVIGVECWDAPWETWSVMSTSPALVSIGEPLIEFNRPREGDGRTWLQGFGGDSQNVAIAAVRQGSSAGYITSLGQDWMGDAFLELWQVRGPRCIAREPPSHGADRRQLRHPRPGRPQVRLPAQEFRRLADDARDAAGRLHRRRPLLPPVGHRPGDQRQRAQDLRRRRFGGTRRRREGLLRHQPPTAAVGPRRRAGDHRRHGGTLRRPAAKPRRFPTAHRPQGAGRHRRSLSQARRARWSR